MTVKKFTKSNSGFCFHKIVYTVLAMAMISTVIGCTSPDQSLILYRLPYEDKTNIKIWQDHKSHNNQIDMAGVNGSAPYKVVAAQSGTVRFIEDSFTQNCSPSVGCNNNYVWIEHIGNEWTKYSHLATNSVTGKAGLLKGDSVQAGQYIGDESNVGMATGSNDGRHLHFEAREVISVNPTPSELAGDLPGTLRIPRFCGVPGQIVEMGEFYTATACPGN